MKIVVANDSFKGSLSSLEAGDAIKTGILKVMPQANVHVRPLADGGEGTVEALVLGMGGKLVTVSVTGPLGEKVDCVYGILEESKTAIMEMSGAAGITLIPDAMRNPLHTTTYGVGEVIKDAIVRGCRHFIVGIGGSATNDGGIGMLQALGYGMLDKEGNQVAFGAKGVKEIVTITDEQVIPELKECSFRVACDVTNPLCGETGCSAIFGPQKGATPEMVKDMDGWLAEYAKLTSAKYKSVDATYPGTGAAGGLGFAFLSYTNAVFESGIQIILEETKLESYVKDADLVVTGEGRLDGQTVYGKAPIGVAKIAKEGMILYTYLHLADNEPLTKVLLEKKIKAVAYETIVGPRGGLPCLAPMSHIAGRLSIQEGAKYLEKTYGGRGVLLAGVPGVACGNVVVLGGGNVGTNACKMAVGMGANVTVLDLNLERLGYLDDIFDKRITTLYASRGNVLEAVKQADLVVGAVLVPGATAPKLIKKEDLKLMKPGAVIVDVAIDQGGNAETSHATTHDDPIYIVDGIIHYCVANMPGAVARTSTLALANATLPYGLKLAEKGVEGACAADKGLLEGLNCYDGKCTYLGVAEALGLEYTDPAELIG